MSTCHMTLFATNRIRNNANAAWFESSHDSILLNLPQNEWSDKVIWKEIQFWSHLLRNFIIENIMSLIRLSKYQSYHSTDSHSCTHSTFDPSVIIDWLVHTGMRLKEQAGGLKRAFRVALVQSIKDDIVMFCTEQGKWQPGNIDTCIKTNINHVVSFLTWLIVSPGLPFTLIN